MSKRLPTEIKNGRQITKPAQAHSVYEKVIIDISSNFLSAPADLIDAQIIAAQKKVCESLHFDISGLWQFLPQHPGTLRMTHVYVPPDFTGDVPDTLDAREVFPWTLEMIRNKKTVILPRTEDAPAAAKRDKDSWRYFGNKSTLVFPLYTGSGEVFGALSWNSQKKEQDFSQEVVSRLQVVSEIFANALQRKFTEKNLRDSEARVRLAAEAAEAGLWSWDYKSDRIWVTDKTRDLYGFLPDEIVTAQRFFDVLHPDDLKRIKVICEQSFREGLTVQTEYRIVLPDKAVRLVAVRTQSFLKPTGEPDCIMGVSFDITECRKSEVERVELRNELAHLARALALNELSTSLAHEINQPLGAILNNATTAKELLLKNRTGNEEFSEILTDIITDTKRAGDIVRKIRGMLKKNATRLESLNINSLIDDVVALFQNQLKLRTISLCLDLQSDLMLVNGDRIKLQQVLLNLITNAVDAMKETPQGTLMICSRMHGNDTVMVNVRDSGTGIAPLIKDTMFNPFVTTKKSGLGVGLSISKSIIEEHGGKIWAEDNPDHGTTVSFTLKIR